MALKDSLPISKKKFAELIDNDMVYVDKTDLVADLARQKTFFFLSRPRRFGKSMLLSTFEELFKNGKGRFKGLNLEKDEPWTESRTYKVVLADFSYVADLKKGQDFDQKFGHELKKQFLRAGLAWSDNPDWADSFDAALDNEEDTSIVLLIDEYDDPLTQVLDNPEEFEDRRKTMASFFKRLKGRSEKFRFVFVTGVTRISDLGLFSGPNNVKDISFVPMYGAIAGITQEELEQKFKPFIPHAAKVLTTEKQEPNDKSDEQWNTQWDDQKVLAELKFNYDGYSFERKLKHKVYNSWSVINFFSQPDDGFKSYWLKSGGRPTLLINYLDNLVSKGAARGQGLGELPDFLALDYVKKTNEDRLSPAISNISDPNFPLYAILFQAGYLTIKKAEGESLYIGIPNYEVRQAFIGLVLERLTAGAGDITQASDFIEKYKLPVLNAFLNKDFSAMMEQMNRIINDYSYESLKGFNEYIFRDVLKSSLNMLSLSELRCHREEHSATGRSDLTVECDKYLYVFELKVTKSRRSVSRVLKTAQEQIIKRGYADRITPKQVVPVAMVIVNESNKVASPLRQVVRLEEVDLNQKLSAKPKRARRTKKAPAASKDAGAK